MIRNIKSIFVKPIGGDTLDWETLPLVPGTATLKVKTTQEKIGSLKTYSLSATLRREIPNLSRDLQVRIEFESGVEEIGSVDLPVRFESERENRLTITAKYKSRGDR